MKSRLTLFDRTDRPRAYELARRATVLACMFVVALFLLTLVQLLLSGGQMGPFAEGFYPQLFTFPLVPFPAFLVVIPALVPPIAAFPIAFTMRKKDIADVAYLIVISVVTFVIPVAYGMAFFFPVRGGLRLPPARGFPDFPPGWGAGWHIAAAPLQAVTILVLVLGIAAAAMRSRRNGGLDGGVAVEIREDPEVWLRLPFVFDRASTGGRRAWHKRAARTVASSVTGMSGAEATKRVDAAVDRARRLRDATCVGTLWAFHEGGEAPVVAKVSLIPSSAMEGMALDESAETGIGGRRIVAPHDVRSRRYGRVRVVVTDELIKAKYVVEGRDMHFLTVRAHALNPGGSLVSVEAYSREPERAKALLRYVVALIEDVSAESGSVVDAA